MHIHFPVLYSYRRQWNYTGNDRRRFGGMMLVEIRFYVFNCDKV